MIPEVGTKNKEDLVNKLSAADMQPFVSCVIELLNLKDSDDEPLIGGGDPLDARYLAANIQATMKSGTDLIYLTIEPAEHGPEITDIRVFLPRPSSGACFTLNNCTLWLSADKKQAAVLPPDGGEGHFIIVNDEIVHEPGKPKGIPAGQRRAAQRLAEMVSNYKIAA